MKPFRSGTSQYPNQYHTADRLTMDFKFVGSLYTAAAKSITIKYVSDDEGEGEEASVRSNHGNISDEE